MVTLLFQIFTEIKLPSLIKQFWLKTTDSSFFIPFHQLSLKLPPKTESLKRFEASITHKQRNGQHFCNTGDCLLYTSFKKKTWMIHTICGFKCFSYHLKEYNFSLKMKKMFLLQIFFSNEIYMHTASFRSLFSQSSS